MKRMLDHAAPVEGEDEGERAGALAQLAKRSGDVSGQPVDHEEEPLRIAKDVVGPLERSVGKRRRRRAEEEPAIVGPREPPEDDASGPETELDRCLIERRQLSAGFDSGAVEQICHIGLGIEDRDGKRSEPLTITMRGNGCDRLAAVKGRNSRRHRGGSDTGTGGSTPLRLQNPQQGLGERASMKPPGVSPEELPCVYEHLGGSLEQGESQLGGIDRAAGGGEIRKTDK